jgi:hypothetical protein
MVPTIGRATGGESAIRIWAALGNPCVSVYVPVPFGGPVPEVLGDETTWWRLARLRDRLEEDPGLIADIRAALAPVEAALEDPTTDPDPLHHALTGLGV